MADNAALFRTALRGNPLDLDEADESGLPSLAEGQYRPYARPSAKPLFSVHFVNAKGHVRSFQNVHLDSDSRFTGDCIELRFMGMEAIKILIHGRALWHLYDLLLQHRAAWVAESPRDFAVDGQPIVLKVNFEPVEPIE